MYLVNIRLWITNVYDIDKYLFDEMNILVSHMRCILWVCCVAFFPAYASLIAQRPFRAGVDDITYG